MEPELTLDVKTIHWERETIEKLLLADVRERRAVRRWRMVEVGGERGGRGVMA